MKNCITILLILLSTLCQAQINLVEHFGNTCAFGKSLQIDENQIHITGTTCIDVGNNQFTLAGFMAGYDLSGNLQYYEQVGDTGRAYRAEKILIDSSGHRYILGIFSVDTLGNPINFGLFVQKRDTNNHILWTTEYLDSLGNANYVLRSAALLDNGHIAICGAHNVNSPFETDILFVVFDTMGSVTVHQQIGTPGVQEEAWSICQYDQNRIAIGANSFSSPNDKNWVLMVDFQGNVLNEYISTSNRRIGVWDIVKTQDGGLACVSSATDGDISTPEFKNYVEKLDSNLNQVWDYTIDGFFSSWNLGTSIVEASNRDLIVGGNYGAYEGVNDTIGYDAFLMRLSPLGDSIWHHGYYYYDKITWSENQNMYDITIDNNRIYFIGDANDFNVAPPPGQSLWLVSTDSNGVVTNLNEVFTEDQTILVYPNPARERINFLIPTTKDAQTIQVYDLHGNLFYQNETVESNHTLDILSWPSGMYIYRIQIEDGVVRGKFLKN